MNASFDRAVDLIDEKTLGVLAEAMAAKRRKTKKSDYTAWKNFHDALTAVLSQYGTVGQDADNPPDFYHSGDWFHRETDGFSFFDPAKLNKDLLFALQDVVAAHHANASIWLAGEYDKADENLVFYITPKVLLGALRGGSAEACAAHLLKHGVSFE